MPCSSEGKINLNNEKSYKNWSLESIQHKSKNQKNLADKLIPLLKKDSELIYSTCSISPEENEEVVSHILNKFKHLKIQKINLDDIDLKHDNQSLLQA